MARIIHYPEQSALSVYDLIYPDTMADAETVDTQETLSAIKEELDRKLVLSRKYGFDEYADEICRLVEKMNCIRRGKL